MPVSFSVVVTAYNNDEFLPQCLESVLRQTHGDWECVVVDDASPDSTADIARGFEARDARFSLLSLKRNGGLHLARRAGVERSRCDYVIFLDADDELSPTALADLAAAMGEERPDIVHFGIEVVGCGVDDDDCARFADNVNAPLGRLDREGLLRSVFDEEGGYVQDWRVTQRAYRGELARAAFADMTGSRLERAEDCYEFLVIADHARDQLTANQVRALRYHYGRGVTGTSLIDSDTFRRFCAQFGECLEAIRSYAAPRGEAFDPLVDGAASKLLDLIMNDWHRRVSDEDKPACARAAASILGAASIASQLMRLSRDDAYAVLSADAPFNGTWSFVEWFHLADELADQAQETDPRFDGYRAAAFSHISDFERRAGAVECPVERVRPVRLADYERQRIRIFVTTHKEVSLFRSSILQPVQVGFARPRKRFLWALQDDAGENIAERNAMYCELTTQYWAWKNVDADYYGFCHYRRYFDFSDQEHEENPYGEIMDRHIDGGTQRTYRLDDESIEAVVADADVITTRVNDVSEFPEHYADMTDHYARAPYLNVDDLTRMMEILAELHPDCIEDAVGFMEGSRACFCNMFIMRKGLFQRYCSWMFPVLERFFEGWDWEHLGREALRTPGHLSERLLNIFLIHEKREHPELRHKELQCVHFEHPEPSAPLELEPVADERPVVPIVLAADDAYVPMLTTTIYSALCNASPERFYDVVVFERNISTRNKRRMREFLSARFDNAGLRFKNVEELVGFYDLSTSNEHISVETYYRFLIQDVMPGYDKVLYLDSDLIVCGDVAELYDTDLGDDLLAAVRDVDYLGNLNMPDGERMRYSRDVLGLERPYDYFQAGVLLLNVPEMRALHSASEWLEISSDPSYIYNDQDILNSCCQGRVTYLDNSWNVMNDCGGRIAKVFSYAPAEDYAAFLRAYENPRVIHYAGFEKPWKSGHCDLREEYWEYARDTPFYETLIGLFATPPVVTVAPVHERALGEGNPMRGVLDPIMPLGTRRREIAKAVARTLRGRS